jgi:cobyrinic acid a,c-diamide synthase
VPTSLGPRLVVAGTSSGVGKTTVATGLVAALRARGTVVAAAKVGPDFIDPGYHALAAGRPPRNLDPWLCGPDAVLPLAGRAAAGAEVLVVEGVMGLFDGAVDGAPSSTADVARLLDAPVVLVVDAASMSRSVAALVHGFATFDPSVRVAGVVLNRVGSDTHEVQLREALAPLGLPVLGALPRDERWTWRDRHLGLVPVAEQPMEVARSLGRLAAATTASLDLDGLLALAATAPTVAVADPVLPERVGRARIAVASGLAFTFTYTDTVEALEAAGAEVVPFDPLHDDALPEAITGLLVGGGFPEVHAAQLADNRPLLADVRARVTSGVATWAECGGLLWLCRELDGQPMAGVLGASAVMGERLVLGYRTATAQEDNPVVPRGGVIRGHEFHHSVTSPGGDALVLRGRFGDRAEGFATPRLLATYLHHHPGGDPAAVARFVAAASTDGTAS